MLFRRNKTYVREESSQAKKSLLERLVIIDADGMESPEEEAEKLQEDPEVDARVVRVRAFAPERTMSSVPISRTVDISEPEEVLQDAEEAPEEEKEEIMPEAPRPLRVERYEDIVSEVKDDEEEEDEERGAESIRISVSNSEEEPVAKKHFDILERAREQEEAVEHRIPREEVRIIYRVPKRSYTDASARNAIHNELIERINNSFGSAPVEEIEETPVYHARENEDDIFSAPFEPELKETVETPALAEEIRSVLGDVSDEHVEEIIHGALADAVQSDEPERNETSDIHWVAGVEDVTDIPRMNHFTKVLFPEEYFYAKDGSVIKTVAQLHEALSNMHDDIYNHHAISRGTNDFANWIEGVYGHADLARRMKATGGRKDMLTLLGLYM